MARQSTRPASSCGSTVEPMACASASTGFGKMQRQIVLAQHREHVHAFLVRRAEDFDDFAFGIRVRDSHSRNSTTTLSPTCAGPAHIARFGHQMSCGCAGRRERRKETGGCVAACRPSACAGVPECGRPFRFPASSLRKLFRRTSRRTSTRSSCKPCRWRFRRMAISLRPGIVRLEKTLARAVHADAAGNQIRLARLT
jgi:hypothetical protein